MPESKAPVCQIHQTFFQKSKKFPLSTFTDALKATLPYSSLNFIQTIIEVFADTKQINEIWVWVALKGPFLKLSKVSKLNLLSSQVIKLIHVLAGS